MADSMIDFGDIAKRAQGQLSNTISMAHLGMQQEQIDNTKAQQRINQQNADTERLNSLHTILKDERFKMDPVAEGGLMNTMSRIAGGPEIDFQSVQMGRQAKVDYFEGMASGNPEQLERGLKTLAPTMSMEDLTKTIKATAEYGKLNEELMKLKQDREMNASKYEVLQNNNALIAYARPLYTEASSAVKFDLRGTTDPHFKKAQGLYETLSKGGGDVSSLMSSKPLAGLNKQGFQHILDGKFGAKALKADEAINGIQQDIDMTKKMLLDAESGKPLPKNLTPAMLKAKLETNSVLQESLGSLKEWYEDPFDKGKHERAIQTQKALEKRRMDIDELDKNTHADTIRVQQDRLGFDQDKERTKRDLDSAVADAQTEFFALPTNQQTPQAAAKIAKQIQDSAGVRVKPEDILYKDPNKPLAQVTNNMGVARALSPKVAERIDKGANVAAAAVSKITTINRMFDAVDSGKVNVGPGANVQQFIGQLAVKFGGGGKTAEERVSNTRTVIQGLAQMVLDNREKMEGQGQISNYESTLAERAATPGEIDKFTIPELKTLLGVSDKSARFEYGLHETRMKHLRSDPNETIRSEARYFEAPPLPPSRFSGKSDSGKASPQGKAAQPAADIPTIKGDQEFNKLPSGAVFIGPDGKRRRKP